MFPGSAHLLGSEWRRQKSAVSLDIAFGVRPQFGRCKHPFSVNGLLKTLRNSPVSFAFLKQRACPHCGRHGTLNRHSRLLGNDPADPAAKRLRGQRVFCSNRGNRPGCGRSFSLFFAEVLPRHTVTATVLWELFFELFFAAAGTSLRAAAQRLELPFALETLYGIRRRLLLGLDWLRAFLCREKPPPPSDHVDPLAQSLAHLRLLFPQSTSAFESFQLHFQQPLFG